MEKYSAYRDPGTGIQPFLQPVPPLNNDTLAKVTLPLAFSIGIIRTALVLFLLITYTVLSNGFSLLLIPLLPLRRPILRLITALHCRLALFILGFYWIPLESVSRKRGRTAKASESWSPKSGDIIVSNWVSWIEILWLAFRYNPVFLLPVSASLPRNPETNKSSSPISHTPGRRTGTGSANITSQSKAPTTRVRISGFKRASLLDMLTSTANVPRSESHVSNIKTLEEWKKIADGPVVVFPECTTSNGRGLLQFASVFQDAVPAKKFRIFIMCVRYDPPTSMTQSPSHSIPSKLINPLSHVFRLASSLAPPAISIRLLSPSESPSSPLFMANEVLSGGEEDGQDQMAEACAVLVAQIGKMKRTKMGWEDKYNFLEFYRGQRKQ